MNGAKDDGCMMDDLIFNLYVDDDEFLSGPDIINAAIDINNGGEQAEYGVTIGSREVRMDWLMVYDWY